MLVRGTLGEVYTLSDLPSFSKQTILCELMEGRAGVPPTVMRLMLVRKAVQKDHNLHANDAY